MNQQLSSPRCPICGQYYSSIHQCMGRPHQVGYAPQTTTAAPLTADEVRKIVCEELERAKTTLG